MRSCVFSLGPSGSGLVSSGLILSGLVSSTRLCVYAYVDEAMYIYVGVMYNRGVVSMSQ